MVFHGGHKFTWAGTGSGTRNAATRLVSGLTVGTLLVWTLTGCSREIYVPPGPDATNPVCAKVVQGAPDSVMGLSRAYTSSQATVAWVGPHDQVVSLRCGAPQNKPSADCITIADIAGTKVDWVLTTNEQGGHLFTTFGRDPLVDVLVPKGVADGQPTAPLPDLNQLVVANTKQLETCDAS